MQVYNGPDTSFVLRGLSAKSLYQVRVCAVRKCSDDSTGDLTGAYSPGVEFTTLTPQSIAQQSPANVIKANMPEPKQLSDQQWAAIILLGFSVFAIIVAFLTQQILQYTSSSSNNSGSGQ